jgi:hypothetical protein
MFTSKAFWSEKVMKQIVTSVLLFFGLILLPVIASSGVMAQGNLLITPRRVVFEGNKKTEELNLANTGADSATYNVSFVQYRMKEDGSFEEIKVPDPGQNFADKNIRFFPRTVTLAPNESQVVKMQVFRTTELPAGEYRSHVYFRALPKQTALGEADAPKDSSALSVKLVPIFGITIPVIIRTGTTSAEVTLSDLSFQVLNDTLPRLNLTFNRTGNKSVYGDIDVSHVSVAGKKTQVGSIRGIAVYTPNLIRRVKMDLLRIPGVDFKIGKLQVTYSGEVEAKQVKYADTELLLK